MAIKEQPGYLPEAAESGLSRVQNLLVQVLLEMAILVLRLLFLQMVIQLWWAVHMIVELKVQPLHSPEAVVFGHNKVQSYSVQTL